MIILGQFVDISLWFSQSYSNLVSWRVAKLVNHSVGQLSGCLVKIVVQFVNTFTLLSQSFAELVGWIVSNISTFPIFPIYMSTYLSIGQKIGNFVSRSTGQ